MEKQDNEKSCDNCRFYVAYYVKRNMCYAPIYKGHCVHENIIRSRRKEKELTLCEFWEDVSTKKEERKKSIKETLELMSGRLNEMVLILKDDKEENS